jgi:hypothetical protein
MSKMLTPGVLAFALTGLLIVGHNALFIAATAV